MMPQTAMSAPAGKATMETEDIRILLVDDHTILREGLAAVLNAVDGFEVVGQAADGEAALVQFRELSPDVAIVDLRMRPMDGVTLTTAMREQNANARVILLTTYDTDEEIFRGLRAGASSYLLKDVDSARLAETIRAVHAGRKEIPPKSRPSSRTMSHPRRSRRARKKCCVVSPRESRTSRSRRRCSSAKAP
jgi:two-component system NarL family response regulator